MIFKKVRMHLKLINKTKFNKNENLKHMYFSLGEDPEVESQAFQSRKWITPRIVHTLSVETTSME